MLMLRSRPCASRERACGGVGMHDATRGASFRIQHVLRRDPCEHSMSSGAQWAALRRGPFMPRQYVDALSPPLSRSTMLSMRAGPVEPIDSPVTAHCDVPLARMQSIGLTFYSILG
jgi:hypothetical protein